MVEEMISGEMTLFWLFIWTLCLTILLISQKNMLREKWDGYVEGIHQDIEDEERQDDQDDDEDPPPPMRWV